MRIALDTNRYVDLCRGDAQLQELVANAESVGLPFVVIAELRAGFALGVHTHENEAVLERFLGKNGVEVLFPSDATTHVYATLFQQLRKQGTPIPVHDIWIAALVVEHGLKLCTRDRHFRHLPQVLTRGKCP